MKIRQFIRLLFLPLTGLCLAGTGCTDDKIFGTDPDQNPEIHFSVGSDTRADPGSGALTAGGQVRIYPYLQKTGVIAPQITPKEYLVEASGTALTPIGSDKKNMFLTSGTFRFYAVSTNSATEAVPVFDPTAANGIPVPGSSTDGGKGIATGLKNGIDYLHVASTDQKIVYGTTTQDVPLQFAHRATQVQLTILFGAGARAADALAATNFRLADVYIQQTDINGAYMRLQSGQIRVGNNNGGDSLACNPQTNFASTMAKMPVAKSGTTSGTPVANIPATQVATYCMVPLTGATDAEKKKKLSVRVTLYGLVLGTTTYAEHTYYGKLDASAGWLAGQSNRYTLTISGTNVTFSGVTVGDWVAGTSGEVGDLTDNGSQK